MKSLIKIYSRYILTACLLIFLLIAANIIFLIGTIIHYASYYHGSLTYGSMHDIAEEIIPHPSERDDILSLSEEGIKLLQKNSYCFAFILSPSGDMIWKWKVPEEFPSHFSSGDIGAFSKWYLHDYPVKVWRCEDSLLVCGRPKYSAWKYQIEFPESFIANLGSYLKYALMINLALLLSFLWIAGCRFYISLRPLAQGIDTLADGNMVSLSEKGVTAELCNRLNQTSLILKEQKEALTKRDDARTEWIAGISHDIRTPLSMIVGYADNLSADDALSAKQRKQADIIKQQSFVIKKLIEDLNLTSKLEYHMQPLSISKFLLAPFLRSLVVAYLNNGLENRYEVELSISDSIENIYIEGDEALLNRAMNNLIGNSVRHNPAGCLIRISAMPLNDNVCSICIHDDGTGIPEQVIQTLKGNAPASGGKPHIMGLRIARQIVLSHQGNFYFSSDRHGVIMEFPTIR